MSESKNVNFTIHETHLPLWERKDWRYAIIMGGRGNGRSGTASRFTVSQLLSKEYTRGAIMRAVLSDIRTSCWGELNNRLDEQEIKEAFKITDNDMHMGYGQNSVRAHGFRASSGSLTARLKSLAEYNYIWAEEAEEIGEEEFRTLDDSLRTVKGRIRIVLTLNPPHKNHWIIRNFFNLVPSGIPDFYIPVLKPEREKDTIFIGGSWQENKPNLDEHTIERYQKYKQTNPAYYYQMIEGFVPEELRGRIFNGWRQIDTIPFGARLVRYGLDFGWFPDPTVLVAIYEHEGEYILDELMYGNYIQNETIASTIRNTNKDILCVADNEEKSINEIRNYGVNIIATEKGKDSVSFRIKTASAVKVSVTSRSKHIWEAYENYAWKETKDGDPTGEPDHLYSHCMDSFMYGLISLPSLQQKEEEKRNFAMRNWRNINKKPKNYAL
jgi:phage terminase large subunit